MIRKDLRVVVTGFIGLLPAGGVTWDYIQYPLGFRELGCDVIYVEDTQLWPVYQHSTGPISCESNIRYLAAEMRRFGLEDRWFYRDSMTGQHFGMPEDAVEQFCRSADVFINLSCSTPLREEYAAIPVRVLIDTDPMFTQVQYTTGKNLAGTPSPIREMVVSHTHLFTFGENIGRPGCAVPCNGRTWLSTRQPVVLKYWPRTALPHSGAYTTVFNWIAAKDFEFEGRIWGQKNFEFLRFLDIPRQVPTASFCIGVGQTTGDPFPFEMVRNEGWQVMDAQSIAYDSGSYQNFIQSSRAEFSVAKHAYVQARAAWFSCRSACYLAAGRPVVTQDTGWSAFIPNGCGLFAFVDSETALAAIRQIEGEFEKNARAARSIAEEVFDSNKVLAQMLSQLGV
jgi:hypothetical protein